jgi:hypothetical protein
VEVIIDGYIYQAQTIGGISRIFDNIIPKLCELDNPGKTSAQAQTNFHNKSWEIEPIYSPMAFMEKILPFDTQYSFKI